LKYKAFEFANSIRTIVSYTPLRIASLKGSIFYVLAHKRALLAARWRVVPRHESGFTLSFAEGACCARDWRQSITAGDSLIWRVREQET
jgi:hypothetical protein